MRFGTCKQCKGQASVDEVELAEFVTIEDTRLAMPNGGYVVERVFCPRCDVPSDKA